MRIDKGFSIGKAEIKLLNMEPWNSLIEKGKIELRPTTHKSLQYIKFNTMAEADAFAVALDAFLRSEKTQYGGMVYDEDGTTRGVSLTMDEIDHQFVHQVRSAKTRSLQVRFNLYRQRPGQKVNKHGKKVLMDFIRKENPEKATNGLTCFGPVLII